MSPARAFWEYPDFWPMIAVILIFALLSALCIALGPDEYGSGEDQDDAAMTPQHPCPERTTTK